MPSDTSEKGLETLIMRHMTGVDGLAAAISPGLSGEAPATDGGTGYIAGSAKDYDRAHAIDVPQLLAFLSATQPEAFKKLALADSGDPKDINRLKFLARLSSEVGKRGVIDVLRKGVDHGPVHVDLFFGTPRRATPRRRPCMRRTASRSRASLRTALTRRAGRSIWACSSMACRLRHSS